MDKTTMAVNGKRKGAAFERSVSKLLSEHLGFQFRPTPQSGAYVGGKNRDSFVRDDVNEILAGDLIAGHPTFPFCVECKAYGDDPKFHHLVQGESKIMDEWITQALSDAVYIDKKPLLVFKINHKGTYAALPKEACEHDQFDNFLVYQGWIIVTLEALFDAGTIRKYHDLQ